MAIIFKNVKVLTPFEQVDSCVVVQGGRIADVCAHVAPAPGDTVIDGRGMYLSPGFIDLHIHGGGGVSAMEGTEDAIIQMGDAHAAYGTTSFLPTALSMPIPDMTKMAQAVQDAMASERCKANILGLHLEGPCLSKAQSGAQAPETLLVPSQADLSPLLRYRPILRMMGIAPELDGAFPLARRLADQGTVVSIAHSDATYDQAEASIRHGFSDVTHLYSGCSGVVRKNAYRVPGVVEAGLNLPELTVQVIADGRHLPLSLLSLIYRCKGADGMYAVTDGLEFSAYAMAEGTIVMQKNGVPALYEDGVMKLTDRSAFAGSAATMNRLVHTLWAAGISLPHAVRMATENPARRVGAAQKGRVEKGFDADLVLFDEDINVKMVMVRGKLL